MTTLAIMNQLRAYFPESEVQFLKQLSTEKNDLTLIFHIKELLKKFEGDQEGVQRLFCMLIANCFTYID